MLITRHSLLDRLWHKFCFTAYILYISHIVGLLGIYTNYLLLYYLLKYGNVQNKLFTWSVGVSLLLHFSHYFYLGLVGRSASYQPPHSEIQMEAHM